jgi:adenylate cyclase
MDHVNHPPLEIERRFLVADPSVLADLPGRHLVQGYLSRDPGRTVRLRLETDGAGWERGWLTVKGPTRLENGACVRREWEVELPAAQVRAGLELCLPDLVEKTRHAVEHAGRRWDVDIFHGLCQGLILAEVELDHPGAPLILPPWVGAEVGADPRYANAVLSQSPRRG